MRTAVVIFSFLGLSAFWSPPVPGGESVRDVSWFLRRMRSVEHLPELENSHTAMSSTWDRTGGNNDGVDFKDLRIRKDTPKGDTKADNSHVADHVSRVPGKPGPPSARNVLLDVDGPGCIHRIFTGMVFPQHAGTRIQIFLDRREKPLFDLPITEFFDYRNGPIPYPLVFHKSYPGTLMPIPFAEHCLVQLVNDQYGKPGWNDALWGNYWQVVYTRYPGKGDGPLFSSQKPGPSPTVEVKSLTWPLEESEKAELHKTCQAWLKAESVPPAEPDPWMVEKTASLEADEELSFRISGGGVIRQMRLQVEPATPEILGSLRMQIAWDAAPDPSVDAPVGYFFGHLYGGYGRTLSSPAAVVDKDDPINLQPKSVEYSTRFHSLLMGVTDSEAYCCFPMPFSRGAVLTFTNVGKEKIDVLRLRLDVRRLDTIPDNWGRFHATWTHVPAATEQTPRFGPLKVPGKIVLDRQGRGKYVGVMLSLDWPILGWWGEGDWLIWADQEAWPPDYHGTGSEEYFNSGWCRFDRKAVSGFVTLRPGHPTVYSFHLNDAFQFQKKIRVVEEQMGDPYIEKSHPRWTSTAYWYSLPAQPAGSDK
jgi:hypothetical protein